VPRGPFAKVYRSLWDGTLSASWPGWSLFVYMLSNCDADGVIDATPEAIASRSGMPLDQVLAGIQVLEAPDPRSRTPDEEGRRILRLEPHRDWGWRIVNLAQFRSGDEDPRSATLRQRRHRASVTGSHAVSRPVTGGDARSREAEAEAEADEQPTLLSEGGRVPPGTTPDLLVGSMAGVAGSDAVFIQLPTNRKGREVAVCWSKVREWAALFPAVDVEQELRNMRAWLLAHGERRKTSRGMDGFVVRWLSDEQDKAGRNPAPRAGHRSGVDERYRRDNPPAPPEARRG